MTRERVTRILLIAGLLLALAAAAIYADSSRVAAQAVTSESGVSVVLDPQPIPLADTAHDGSRDAFDRAGEKDGTHHDGQCDRKKSGDLGTL